MSPASALKELSGPAGPDRFARVDDALYRGGQPSRRHLELLRALGVRTIVNLRREDARQWLQEELDARQLGFEFFHFPFYGVFGADERFVMNILQVVRRGRVYLHCKHGRDRTSLIVALYRVMQEGWDAHEAWQREAIDYGSLQTLSYRQLRVTYARMVRKYFHHQPPEWPPAPS